MEMKSDSWFPCYPADLIADTAHLSSHDFGAYFRLLCWYYLKGPPPDDDEHLQNVMRVDSTVYVRTKGNVVTAFFTLDNDGRWHQKRADEEIARREDVNLRRYRQTEAARQARLGQGNVTDNVTTNVTENVTMPVTAVQPQPQPQPQKQETHTHTVRAPSPSQKFQEENRYEWLKAELCRLYNRPSPNLLNYEDQSSVAEVSRRPDVKAELAVIKGFRPKCEQRYFPQSLAALCRDWDKTLDRARNYRAPKVPYKEKPLHEKEIDAMLNELQREGA